MLGMPDFVLILYNDAISTLYYAVKWQHDYLLTYNSHTCLLLVLFLSLRP